MVELISDRIQCTVYVNAIVNKYMQCHVVTHIPSVGYISYSYVTLILYIQSYCVWLIFPLFWVVYYLKTQMRQAIGMKYFNDYLYTCNIGLNNSVLSPIHAQTIARSYLLLTMLLYRMSTPTFMGKECRCILSD